MLYEMLLNLTALLTAFSYPDSLRQTGSAVWQWSKSLRACVIAKSEHFEHRVSQQIEMLLLLITAYRSLPDMSAKCYQFPVCLFKDYTINQGGPVIMPYRVLVFR